MTTLGDILALPLTHPHFLHPVFRETVAKHCPHCINVILKINAERFILFNFGETNAPATLHLPDAMLLSTLVDTAVTSSGSIM